PRRPTLLKWSGGRLASHESAHRPSRAALDAGPDERRRRELRGRPRGRRPPRAAVARATSPAGGAGSWPARPPHGQGGDERAEPTLAGRAGRLVRGRDDRIALRLRHHLRRAVARCGLHPGAAVATAAASAPRLIVRAAVRG